MLIGVELQSKSALQTESSKPIWADLICQDSTNSLLLILNRVVNTEIVSVDVNFDEDIGVMLGCGSMIILLGKTSIIGKLTCPFKYSLITDNPPRLSLSTTVSSVMIVIARV